MMHVMQAAVLDAPIVELSFLDIVLAAGLILVAVGMSRWQRVELAKDIAVGAVRSVLQLVLVGYALVYIFGLDRWYLVVAALLLMLGLATREAVKRQKAPSRVLLGIVAGAMLVGSGLILLYVGAVIRVEPWYNPRYLIPLFGMIAGNAMNAAALASERLTSEVDARRPEIEAYLALGAAPAFAARDAVRNAIRASMIPMVNSLMVVGVVALPGMMTGQILAGVSPLTAVRYQIVVMFMLMAAVAVTGTFVTVQYRKTFFTAAEQLR